MRRKSLGVRVLEPMAHLPNRLGPGKTLGATHMAHWPGVFFPMGTTALDMLARGNPAKQYMCMATGMGLNKMLIAK